MTSGSRHAWPSLENRSVIITGGGRGLGREMALALAQCGANVLITAAKSANELTAVKAEAASFHGNITTALADTCSYSDCERVLQQSIDEFGPPHCLINNAGRGMRLISETFNTTPALFWKTDPQQWRTIVDINVNGVFNMARAVTPLLVEQGFGKIINISTSHQTMVRTGYAPYGPSKAALEAASCIWARDLAGSGVTVNVLLPGGATDTALLPDSAGARKTGADGMLLSPTLMREPALWLCSDESDNHTGQRFIARLWDIEKPPSSAAQAAREDGAQVPQIM